MNQNTFMLALLSVTLLSGCAAQGKWEAKYPTGYDRTETNGDIYAPRQTIWKNGSPINKILRDGIKLK